MTVTLYSCNQNIVTNSQKQEWEHIQDIMQFKNYIYYNFQAQMLCILGFVTYHITVNKTIHCIDSFQSISDSQWAAIPWSEQE